MTGLDNGPYVTCPHGVVTWMYRCDSCMAQALDDLGEPELARKVRDGEHGEMDTVAILIYGYGCALAGLLAGWTFWHG